MRSVLFGWLLVWAATAHADGWWESLWRTADQRGEQLMRQGDATAAADTFSDPRRKAYAELQAGHYAKAARDFAAFDDSNGNYNRGNALARAGQLQEAIKAYDAALARDPGDRDARHNRDLVAQELQRRSSQPEPSSGKGSSSNDQDSGGKRQANGKDAGKQGGASADSSARNSAGKNQIGKDQQGKSGQGSTEGNSKPGQNAGQDQQSSARLNTSNPFGGKDAHASQANGESRSGSEAAQARRDAAAGLGKLQPGPETASTSPTVSEQRLAQEQWLRRIPDDPGGLLRRKFMIEHMIRQQRGQP